jgi:hypothetical protein
MTSPLVSEGDLKVDGTKISWHMKTPFDLDTIITPEEITQSIDGGPAQPVGGDTGNQVQPSQSYLPDCFKAAGRIWNRFFTLKEPP